MATPPPPSIVILTAAGPTTLAGSKVTLNCSSDVMGSFVWSHSSISDLSSAASVAINQDASGVFSVLTISSVLISHAGTYSCEVSAAGAPSTQFYDLRVQCESSFIRYYNFTIKSWLWYCQMSQNLRLNHYAII